MVQDEGYGGIRWAIEPHISSVAMSDQDLDTSSTP